MYCMLPYTVYCILCTTSFSWICTLCFTVTVLLWLIHSLLMCWLLLCPFISTTVFLMFTHFNISFSMNTVVSYPVRRMLGWMAGEHYKRLSHHRLSLTPESHPWISSGKKSSLVNVRERWLSLNVNSHCWFSLLTQTQSVSNLNQELWESEHNHKYIHIAAVRQTGHSGRNIQLPGNIWLIFSVLTYFLLVSYIIELHLFVWEV